MPGCTFPFHRPSFYQTCDPFRFFLPAARLTWNAGMCSELYIHVLLSLLSVHDLRVEKNSWTADLRISDSETTVGVLYSPRNQDHCICTRHMGGNMGPTHRTSRIIGLDPFPSTNSLNHWGKQGCTNGVEKKSINFVLVSIFLSNSVR